MPYQIEELREARRNQGERGWLFISATLPSGQRVTGPVIGMGSMVAVRDMQSDALVEDIKAEWVTGWEVVEV
ncbi:hypothetical protein [Streptomyces smyrnaeus]|uniref:hypothetical protein n=1 Tax=Streptomyces smyrnaeus TaxID=1387713 RepID=UPI00369D60FE